MDRSRISDKELRLAIDEWPGVVFHNEVFPSNYSGEYGVPCGLVGVFFPGNLMELFEGWFEFGLETFLVPDGGHRE